MMVTKTDVYVIQTRFNCKICIASNDTEEEEQIKISCRLLLTIGARGGAVG
jgi:hypothetical protein